MSASKEAPTIYRIIDNKCVKRLIMFLGIYPINMEFSEDDGKSWSLLEPIGYFGVIVAIEILIRLKTGDYMTLFHAYGRYIKKF